MDQEKIDAYRASLAGPVPNREDLIAAPWNAYAPNQIGDVRIEADWGGEDWPIATVRAEYSTLFLAAPAMKQEISNVLRLFDRDDVARNRQTRIQDAQEGVNVFMTRVQAGRLRALLNAI